MDTVKYPRVRLGVSKNNDVVYLTPPSWECGFAWSWTWIGSPRFHTQLRCINKEVNLYGAINEYLTDIPLSDKDLLTFSELVATFYALKEVADIHNRGGSHYTTNPMAYLLKDEDRCNHINQVLLPAIFVEAYKLFERKNDN